MHHIVHGGAQKSGASGQVGLLQQVGQYWLLGKAPKHKRKVLELLYSVATHIPCHNLPLIAQALRGQGSWLGATQPRRASSKCTAPHTRWGGEESLVWRAAPSCPRGCSKLL